MPIAADFTPEASSVRCLFRSAPIEQEVSQAFPQGVYLDMTRREKIQHYFEAVNNDYVLPQQKTQSRGYSQVSVMKV